MKTPHYDYMYTQAVLADKIYRSNWIRSMFDQIESKIDDARIFKIPNELSELFHKTDPIESYLLPFETLFLEQHTKVNENLIINGIFCHQIPDSEKHLLENPQENMVWVFVNYVIDNSKMSSSFLLSKSQGERTIAEGSNAPDIGQEHVKHAEKIIYNFLCFVNSPDIEYVTKIDSPRDTKIRIRKYKPPRPPIANIVLTNPLKRYIHKQKTNQKMIYSHRFWVRGHWRTLRSERYGENRGKTIWIKPYIKGEGLLLPKQYDLRLIQ